MKLPRDGLSERAVMVQSDGTSVRPQVSQKALRNARELGSATVRSLRFAARGRFLAHWLCPAQLYARHSPLRTFGLDSIGTITARAGSRG